MLIRQNPRIPTLAAVAATAAAAFTGLARLERDHRLTRQDRKASGKIAGPLKKYQRFANLLHPIGKWWTYVPAALAAGATVYARGSGRRPERAAGAAAIMIAATASALV